MMQVLDLAAPIIFYTYFLISLRGFFSPGSSLFSLSNLLVYLFLFRFGCCSITKKNELIHVEV
jgi:hypothetical protein